MYSMQQQKKGVRTPCPRAAEARSLRGWNPPGSCCPRVRGAGDAFDSNHHGKELHRYGDKTERGAHAGHKSGKFSRTVSMFMRILVKKMNVQEIYKYNLIPSYYRYRNYLIILLDIHLYLFLLAESLQKLNQWQGCYLAEAPAFHPEQRCSRGSPCSAAAPVSAPMLCTALKAQTAF